MRKNKSNLIGNADIFVSNMLLQFLSYLTEPNLANLSGLSTYVTKQYLFITFLRSAIALYNGNSKLVVPLDMS